MEACTYDIRSWWGGGLQIAGKINKISWFVKRGWGQKIRKFCRHHMYMAPLGRERGRQSTACSLTPFVRGTMNSNSLSLLSVARSREGENSALCTPTTMHYYIFISHQNALVLVSQCCWSYFRVIARVAQVNFCYWQPCAVRMATQTLTCASCAYNT